VAPLPFVVRLANDDAVTDSLLPLRCLSSIAVLDASLEGWALLGEPASPEQPRIATLQVVFDAPFAVAPIVHIGLAGLDVSKFDNTRLRTRAQDVTPNGFVVCVETWLNTQIWSVEVSWLAIGT
jgi:H-type lectin domain